MLRFRLPWPVFAETNISQFRILRHVEDATCTRWPRTWRGGSTAAESLKLALLRMKVLLSLIFQPKMAVKK